jgi:hypothetical protein
LEEGAEVGSGELPLERTGELFVVVLEGEQALGDLVEAGEVAGCEDLALDDREEHWTLCLGQLPALA